MRYLVRVRKDGREIARYEAIGNTFDLHDAAIDEFGACSVSVMVQR